MRTKGIPVLKQVLLAIGVLADLAAGYVTLAVLFGHQLEPGCDQSPASRTSYCALGTDDLGRVAPYVALTVVLVLLTVVWWRRWHRDK